MSCVFGWHCWLVQQCESQLRMTLTDRRSTTRSSDQSQSPGGSVVRSSTQFWLHRVAHCWTSQQCHPLCM